MPEACPAPGPDDPLVSSLLTVVDCNVQALVYGGYSALFQPNSPFAAVLTSLMVILVALVGYQLLLGRGQLRVGDVALTAVKLGAVLALTTQWSTYQALVYDFLFNGPEQLANVITARVRPDGGALPAEVFPALQVAFDALTGHAAIYARQAPPGSSPLLGGAGFGALGLTVSASILLLSSLGVMLAAKIVTGVLLAVGPVFIAMLLFDTTRGLFEGWLRAALAFAFAPLATILLLAVGLAMLEPSLIQLEELRVAGRFELAPVYSILTLVLVFALVSAGLLIAGGVASAAFRLPQPRAAAAATEVSVSADRAGGELGAQPRAARVAAAVAAMDRRESVMLADGAGGLGGAAGAGGGDRRVNLPAGMGERGLRESGPAVEARLGQSPRRNARPRQARASARS
jgi:type IV secretion system protein VirB6